MCHPVRQGAAVNVPLMKARRERLRLRQADVASALGVDRSTVASWETGRASPEARLIRPLAELLKISADELLADPADPKVAAG
jgi:transcriptional regulator with XRE-family HTH domain